MMYPEFRFGFPITRFYTQTTPVSFCRLPKKSNWLKGRSRFRTNLSTGGIHLQNETVFGKEAGENGGVGRYGSTDLFLLLPCRGVVRSSDSGWPRSLVALFTARKVREIQSGRARSGTNDFIVLSTFRRQFAFRHGTL
jgi:hypothetical protein